MPYSPLTPQQFQSAKDAGFTTDKIIEMEKERKTNTPGSDAPPMNDRAGRIAYFQQQAQQAQQESQQANSFGTQAKAFLGGAVGEGVKQVVGAPLKLGISASNAPADIIRNVRGLDPLQTDIPVTGGKTYQAEAAQRVLQGQNPALNIGTAALGVGADAAATAGLLKGTESLLQKGGQALGNFQSAKQAKNAIAAVTELKTGKKLGAATERTGLLKTQGQAASAGEKARGLRLKNILTSTDPYINQNKAKQALSETINSLDTKLATDHTSANYESLFSKWDKTKIPEGFKSVATDQNQFQRVINVAKDTALASGDDTKASLSARQAFDATFKQQFPNAIKNGYIQTNTPAGNAWKIVRDIWNDHLYENAPKELGVQQDIGKMRDLYRAMSALEPKVAKLQGTNTLTRLGQKLAPAAKIAGAGAAIGAGLAGVRKYLGSSPTQ